MQPRRFLTSLACVAAVGGHACTRKPIDAKQDTSAVIAHLAGMKGSVEHRASTTLTWTSAHQSMDLLHRDAVKTGRGATARVDFVGGGWIDLDEESLVIIELSPTTSASGPTPSGALAAAPQVARVEQGTVRGVATPGVPVDVITPEGQRARITVEGTEAVPFRARVGKSGKLEVAVLKGVARVESGGGAPVVVKPNELVEVAAARVAPPVRLPPFPELSSPTVDEKFHAGIKVPLRWRAVEGASLYRVQVSASIGFEQRLVDETVTVPELNLAGPTPGRTYVWRVSTLDPAGHEGEFGFARRFHVLTAPPPPRAELLHPPDNAGIQYAGEPKPIVFSWRSDEAAFELVVARAQTLDRAVVLRREVKGTTTTVSSLTSGVYFWGVYAVTPSGKKPIFDQARRIVLARRLPPGLKVPATIDWK